MSVLKCDACDQYIDTDESPEEIAVWEPFVKCNACFDGMDVCEVWNLAMDAAISELRYGAKPDEKARIAACLEKLKK